MPAPRQRFKFWFLTEGTPTEPALLAKQIGVLGRERTRRDELPESDRVEFMSHPRWTVGRTHTGARGDPIIDESRMLMDDLGPEQGTLHALPTKRGWVLLVPSRGLGAVLGFANFPESGVVAGASENSYGIALYGLVQDPGADIEVILTDDEHRVGRSEDGAFFIQLSGDDARRAARLLVAKEDSETSIPISLEPDWNRDQS